MHHNVFYDTKYGLNYEPSLPEVVYRSRGPPLSCLHARAVLAKNRTFVTEQQRLTGRAEVINGLASCRIHGSQSPIPCLVAPCGFNHTEIELIGIGGQNASPTFPWDTNDVSDTPLSQCFKDIASEEYGPDTTDPTSPPMNAVGVMNLLSDCAEIENGGSPAFQRPFRFKRLARCRPRSLGTDRITDIQVDDKRNEKPIVYARNGNGLVTALFHVAPWDEEAESLFPSVEPLVLSDTTLDKTSTINALFVSPHAYGVAGIVTAKRQLVVWDATISSPLHKIDLFRSTSRHIAQNEMQSRTYGNLALDVIDCGCFTDRPHEILIGGNKLYMVDLRCRTVGFLFPGVNTRPPHVYRYPKFTTRLPHADHFLSIAQHPNQPSLYGLISGVTSSIYLWDIRNPYAVVDEIPLPLLRHVGFRSLMWSSVPEKLSPSKDDSCYLLASFSWMHNTATVNLVSVYGSQSIITPAREQRLKLHLKDSKVFSCQSQVKESPSPVDDHPHVGEAAVGSLVELVEEDAAFSSEDDESTISPIHDVADAVMIQERPLTEFWLNTSDGESDPCLRHPFFVNPLIQFHSPTSTPFPVCEKNGLCFSSERPPLQVVVYQQLQVPLGIPSITSETRYFCPMGPPLDSSDALMNAIEAPLAEAPLTQLFHGLAGAQLLPLQLPGIGLSMVFLGLTFSGRLQALRVMLTKQKRMAMFGSACQNVGSSQYEKVSRAFCIPQSDRARTNGGPVPTFDAFSQALQAPRRPNLNDGPVGWSTLPQRLQKHLDELSLLSLEPGRRIQEAFILSVPGDVRVFRDWRLLGLHELLRCNDDNLLHYSVAVGDKMAEWRRRMSELALHRFPKINPVYFAEALIDLLITRPPVVPSKMSDTSGDVSQFFDSGCEKRCFTLRDLLADCVSESDMRQRLTLLRKKAASYWVASTASFDCSETDVRPFPAAIVNSSWRWKPLGDRIGTPLCSCRVIRESCMLALPPLVQSERATVASWTPLTPIEQRIVFQSLARLALHQPQLTSERTGLRVSPATLELLARVLLHVLPAVPVSPATERRENQRSVYPMCNIFNNKNLHCCLIHHLILRPCESGVSQPEQLVQGRKFINVSHKSLQDVPPEEQQFILDNAPRDYPMSYAFLTGVRITVDLYKNLDIYWPPITHRDIKIPWPENAYFAPFTAPDNCRTALDHMTTGDSDASATPSTPFLLPHVASTAEKEHTLSETARQQKSALSALSQQLLHGNPSKLQSSRSSTNLLIQSLLNRSKSQSSDQPTSHLYTPSKAPRSIAYLLSQETSSVRSPEQSAELNATSSQQETPEASLLSLPLPRRHSSAASESGSSSDVSPTTQSQKSYSRSDSS